MFMIQFFNNLKTNIDKITREDLYFELEYFIEKLE